jgi:hypothetical protein
MYRFVLFNSLGCKLVESVSYPVAQTGADITLKMIEWLQDNHIFLEGGDIVKVIEVEVE